MSALPPLSYQLPDKDTLWITDAEMIRRMGVPEKVARATIRMLDAQASGFPRKQKIWGDRRYWPDVVAYFNKEYGRNLAVASKGGLR